jgi:hypothetical protein
MAAQEIRGVEATESENGRVQKRPQRLGNGIGVVALRETHSVAKESAQM